MHYRDKVLEAKYHEYKSPIKFISKYKGVNIIELSDRRFTIFKNKEEENHNIIFQSVKEVKEYIDGFDHYSPDDKRWFLQ